MKKKGKVFLVGAGPGDPGLITQRGIECLQQADVIVYDRLLDESLLDLAPLEAERICVGKAAGRHSRPQEEINRLLVAEAGEGKTVVRLKGGDPFVLGRGGEEALALAKNGIPFAVVPGITSAVAAPAYAGIPVTHRGVASSFTVVTGHEDPAKGESSLDWAGLAAGTDTLVFLMGMKNLTSIVARLVANGRPEETPVAVIAEGTRPQQKTMVGSLRDIVAKVTEHDIDAPAVVVIGAVAGLREEMRWFEDRPLFGKQVLVTRASRQAGALSHILRERGAQPVELPAIDILETDGATELERVIGDLAHYDWLLFTSVNGVAAFFRRLHNAKEDARTLHGLKIGAIGPATAAALQERGITADYLPEVYTGQGLLSGLGQLDIAGQHFLLPRADIADNELAAGLTRLGATVQEVVAYRTVPAQGSLTQAAQLLRDGAIDVITFTSSSTVTNLAVVLKREQVVLTGVAVACIGPKTADTARRAGFRVDVIAAEQTVPVLVAAIEEYYGEGG